MNWKVIFVVFGLLNITIEICFAELKITETEKSYILEDTGTPPSLKQESAKPEPMANGIKGNISNERRKTQEIIEGIKWYGPLGYVYVKFKEGKLYLKNIVYYPSKNSESKWYGPGGYIYLSDGKLFTPSGTFYPSHKK